MYELIVIACLLNQPARCEEFYLPFQQATDALASARRRPSSSWSAGPRSGPNGRSAAGPAACPKPEAGVRQAGRGWHGAVAQGGNQPGGGGRGGRQGSRDRRAASSTTSGAGRRCGAELSVRFDHWSPPSFRLSPEEIEACLASLGAGGDLTTSSSPRRRCANFAQVQQRGAAGRRGRDAAGRRSSATRTSRCGRPAATCRAGSIRCSRRPT